MSKRLVTLVLGVFFFVGCADSVSTPSELAVESSEDVVADDVRVFEVTIKNLTSGQPFRPGVVVSHNPRVKLFRSGDPASAGIKDIAETGDPTAALAALTGAPGIHEVVGTGAPGAPHGRAGAEHAHGRDLGRLRCTVPVDGRDAHLHERRHRRIRPRQPAWWLLAEGSLDLPPRVVPHPMLVPAPVEGREGRASSGTRATA